ncbi:MAG TPA: hypothetical protein PLK12_04400 [Prolixibacteraceae bacterium]|nr:hypothetical protein [Prolixibacteraceae bacterium]
MKHIKYFPVLFVFFLLLSCNDSILQPEVEPGDGLNIQIGSRILYSENDIDYYDHSAHYFYFKKSFGDWLRDYRNAKFWITRDGNVIFEGLLSDNGACCVNSDSLLIYDTFNLPSFVLKLGNRWQQYASDTVRADGRENASFLNELKERGLFYRGLECTVHSVRITGVNEVVVSYIITNSDPWGYYFLDPDKIPVDHISNLDRCLSFRDFEQQTVHYAIPYYDSTWIHNNGWENEWLTLIEPGMEQAYTTKYQLTGESDILKPGKYWMRMIVPGLSHQISKPEERFLENGRIWLGQMELFQKIEIE